jgi:hypothetical protein
MEFPLEELPELDTPEQEFACFAWEILRNFHGFPTQIRQWPEGMESTPWKKLPKKKRKWVIDWTSRFLRQPKGKERGVKISGIDWPSDPWPRTALEALQTFRTVQLAEANGRAGAHPKFETICTDEPTLTNQKASHLKETETVANDLDDLRAYRS